MKRIILLFSSFISISPKKNRKRDFKKGSKNQEASENTTTEIEPVAKSEMTIERPIMKFSKKLTPPMPHDESYLPTKNDTLPMRSRGYLFSR
jgi:hypothetical protein